MNTMDVLGLAVSSASAGGAPETQGMDAAGWRQDAKTPTRYAKIDPTTHPGEETETATSDTASNVALSGTSTAPPTAGSDHPSLVTPLHRAMTGLDEWETDGGSSIRPDRNAHRRAS